MMLVRYQNQVAGFIGATRYYLAPALRGAPLSRTSIAAASRSSANGRSS